MRLSISNIAWDPSEDAAVADLLQRRGIDAIDLAPAKYFPDVTEASAAQAARVKGWWAERGIALWGMQALLFGTQGLNVFGTAAVQDKMLAYLKDVCRIAAELGIGVLTFGSPRQRDRQGVTDAQAQTMAVDFFGRLGDVAQSHGVRICLEPNPPAYGCNFMTHSLAAVELVESLGHPGIWMQLDSGAMALNDESPEAMVERCAQRIGHVHASEPHLAVLGEGRCDHRRVGAALRAELPDHVVTIEMAASKDRPHLEAIAQALTVAQACYAAGSYAQATA